jgi:hypothetical protein
MLSPAITENTTTPPRLTLPTVGRANIYVNNCGSVRSLADFATGAAASGLFSPLLQVEHLADLQVLRIERRPRIVLDLQEPMSLDAEAVRFLGSCREHRVSLPHCSRYVREWIANE